MRVILADDARMLRHGIARLLQDRGIDVIAEVDDGDALIEAVKASPPDVAIVDIRMPPTLTDEGLKAAKAIRAAHRRVAVMVLSQHIEVHYAMQLVDDVPERVGYLLKDRVTDIDVFIRGLRHIWAGGSLVDPALVAELMTARERADPRVLLTASELNILRLLAEGRTDRGIAEELTVSIKTVETHVRSVFRKLDLPADSHENRRVHAVLRYLSSAATPPN
jgi:DNA-binding NarL/FixJ family response regulator